MREPHHLFCVNKIIFSARTTSSFLLTFTQGNSSLARYADVIFMQTGIIGWFMRETPSIFDEVLLDLDLI